MAVAIGLAAIGGVAAFAGPAQASADYRRPMNPADIDAALAALG
jgi:hypothetical protein